MVRKILLSCGILSSLLYVVMNVFVAMQWKEYSSASQTVSELSAIGAPTRRLWVSLGIFYTLLVTAFGFGISASARRNMPLRVVGVSSIAYGLIGLVWPFAPMHLRGAEASLTDTMHIVLAMVTVLLMLLAIGYSSAALGRRFRLYSIATLAILAAFGALTGLDGPRIAANLPTPWVGVWERISIGGFLLWVVVLAIARLRVEDASTSRVDRSPRLFGRSVRATSDESKHSLPGDELISQPIASLTHAITIRRPPPDVWPWLAQMGAGRAGWYSYDLLDNGRRPSAVRVIPALQNVSIGTVFPALPGVKDGFHVLGFEPERVLVLGWETADNAPLVTWAFVLHEAEDGTTRLVVRARAARGYRFHGLPSWLGSRIAAAIHFVMQRKQLLGIARRVETGHVVEPAPRSEASRNAA